MTYTDLITTKPLMVDPQGARVMLCDRGGTLLKAMEVAKWIKPVLRQHRMTRYLVEDLEQCVRRLKTEGYPRTCDSEPDVSR